MRYVFFIVIMLSGLSFAQEVISLNSRNVPYSDSTLVYTPMSYDKSLKYPTVFLLHGYEGNHRQWSGITDLQKLADEYNFVIVCPDGFYDSWYVNSPVRKNYRFYDFFIFELFPFITKNYSVDKDNIFISGLSMGGFGAISFFLNHQDIFKSAGSTSGVLNIKTFANNWGMDKSIGVYNDSPQNYSKFDVLEKLDTLKIVKPFLIDCGTEDRIYVTNKEFFEKCLLKKFPVTFLSQPGRHDKKYWGSTIIQHFNYFKNLVIEK
ncbi:MAG: alpha/beta hydrolase [Ignavibacteriaceae bacterium]